MGNKRQLQPTFSTEIFRATKRFELKTTNAMRTNQRVLLRQSPVGLFKGLGASTLVLGTAFAAGGLCSTPWELLKLLVHVSFTVWTTILRILARGLKPLYPEWTLQFELVRAIMRCCTDLYGHKTVDLKHARYIRWQSEVLGTLAGSVSNRYHKIIQSSVMYNGLEHLWLKPACSACSESPTCTSSNRLVVLYLHGGGCAVLSPRMYTSFCNSLSSAIKKELNKQLGLDHVRLEVFVANYRKVPEHRFPVPAEDAVTMYRYLVHKEKISPKQIIVAGDSAGGSLTMSVLLRLRSQSPELMPLAGMLSCTFADLASSYQPHHAASKPHCLLSHKQLEAGRLAYHKSIHDPSTWEDASSVHCNLQNLPPVFVQAGGLDYLFEHSVRLFEKAKADGVQDWELDVHANLPHVFTVFPSFILPYANVGIQRMADFAARQASQQMAKPMQDAVSVAA